MSFFMDIARALNPEVSQSEPKHIFRWRQTVAFSIVLLSGLTLFNISQANGWLSWIGVPGFVTVVQMSNVEQLLKDTREDQLVQQILDQTRRYCQAFEANDSEGMRFAFRELQAARIKYERLLKREYPQLMCSMSAQPTLPPTER